MRDVQTALNRPRSRVLLVANDRRYRAVTATLLSQRGYDVAAGSGDEDVVELAVRERAQVVVLDASSSLTEAACQVARLDSLRPRVGVVAVSTDSGSRLAALPVLAKWCEFDELSAAVDRAGESTRLEVAHVVR
jgi:DNA-binding NtrC family response regulator